LEIHHIVSREIGGSNAKDNLILVCANCHSKITTSEITLDAVTAKKDELRNRARKRLGTPSSNIIAGKFNNNFVANNINITVGTGKQKVFKFNYPANSIGSELDKLNYVKHLIKRYHEFKKKDPSHQEEKMKNAMIYSSIQREFHAKYDLIPLERFDDLVAWIQSRIDKTVFGKIHKSKGAINYCAFPEYLQKVYG